MSSGNELHEMEVGTKQSKTAVNSGAAAADAMDTSVAGSYEDLGGPTPENYKPDDDSAKLKEPTLKTVADVVNKGAGKADPMPKGMKEEEEVADEAEVVAEEETTEEEVVAEEETVEEEVVAEEETTEEETVAEYDIEEDVNALLAGEELSEEFQEKARTIFEAAITSKVAEIKEELEQAYAVALEEEIQEFKESAGTRIDSYLEYVAEEWFTENRLAVEGGLKSEMVESFMSGMKGLFEEHYVTIPEDRYDVLESMVDKLDEMESKLNEQIDKNVALNRRLAESVADVIFAEVSEGLALTQKEKLASLAENVEFDSEETYREKLVTLRNSYFSESATSAQREVAEEVETVEESAESVSPLMESYLSVLSRASKK